MVIFLYNTHTLTFRSRIPSAAYKIIPFKIRHMKFKLRFSSSESIR